MYFTLNKENVVLNFNPSITVRIGGPDDFYVVEVKEFQKNEDFPSHLESYKVTPHPGKHFWREYFSLPIEFYLDFEVSIHKVIEGIGLKRIYTHRFCDYGKYVLFNLFTDNKVECEVWLDRVKEYERLHECKVVVNTKFQELNKKFGYYYSPIQIDYYKTYNIGRFPKSSEDFRTKDPRKHDKLWFGNYKTFWSYQHPRPWVELNSQEIIDDILGL